MLKDHIDEGHLPMEEPVEVELEEEVALPDTCELIFGFWGPWRGHQACRRVHSHSPPEDRLISSGGSHDVIAASWSRT